MGQAKTSTTATTSGRSGQWQTLLCAVMKNCYLRAQFERNLVTRFAT